MSLIPAKIEIKIARKKGTKIKTNPNKSSIPVIIRIF